jgi:hypothetical protein
MISRVPLRPAFISVQLFLIGVGALFSPIIGAATAATSPSNPSITFPKVEVICDAPNGQMPVLNVQKFMQYVVSQSYLLPLLDRTYELEDQKLDAALIQTVKQGGTPDLGAWSSRRAKVHQDVLRDMVIRSDFCSSYGTCQKDDGAADQKKIDEATTQRQMTDWVRLVLGQFTQQGDTNGGTSVTFAPPTRADFDKYKNVKPVGFLQDPHQYPLRCVAPGAPQWQQDVQNTATSFVKHFELRSVPDQLAVPVLSSGQPAPVDLAHDQDNNYLSSNAAKLSFGQTSGTGAVTNNVIGTLGVPVPLGDLGELKDTALTPYIGIDRETKIQTTKGKTTTTFSANTLDYGLALSGDIGPTQSTGWPWWFISVRPDYLRNYVNGSDILSLNTKFSPVFSGEYLPINHLTSMCDPTAGKMMVRCMLQVDLRADTGWFMNYGHPADPRLNEDYVRVGGLIGPQLELDLLPSNPIDLAATYTDFYPLRGFRKSLGLFQTSATFNFDPSKIVGLTLQYSNGRRDDTAEPVQLWSIGLTLHY